MKKILAIIITALVLVTAIAIPAMAARNARQSGFVDADNDGICDNRAENCPAQSAGNAPTGDTAPIMMYMVLAMAAMVLMAVAETKRRFVRR